MAKVIDALREEHRNLARLLRALEHQVAIFDDGGAPDYDVIVGVADYFLDYPDRCHHPKEEVIVRRLRAMHPAEASEFDLTREHSNMHELAVGFRQTVAELLADTDIPRQEIVDAAYEFIDHQRRHMFHEEASFLPLAERVMSADDWQAIDAELGTRADPVFGGRVEAMFRTLSERLLAWEAEDERAEAFDGRA